MPFSCSCTPFSTVPATVAEAMLDTTLRVAALATAAFLSAPPAPDSGGPGLLLGATEDAVRSTSPVVAKTQMDLLVRAGFRGVRITQTWAPGQREVSAADVKVLRNVATAAQLDGVTVVTTVMNIGSKTTPLSDQDQLDFAAYAASVAGVSPALRPMPRMRRSRAGPGPRAAS